MISLTISRLKTISALLALGMVFSCKNSIEEIDALTDPYSLPVQTTENAEYFYSERGVLKNKLEASKLERFIGEDEERLEVSGGFSFHTYDSLQEISSTLSAKNGTYYEERGEFIATDEVELSNSKGEILNTERLVWLQNQDLVYTDQLVKITTKDGVLWGDSLTSNSTFDNYKLFKPRGELDIKEEENADL